MTDKQREVRNRWLRMADRADHEASFAERKGEQADATKHRELSRGYRIAAAQVESGDR